MKTQRQRNEYMRQWGAANREKARATRRASYQRARMPYIARTVQKRGGAKGCVPSWLTKDHWRQIAEFYEHAQRLTLETGILHVVDHIDALKVTDSCGLHVPWNLQVITHRSNVQKGFMERKRWPV